LHLKISPQRGEEHKEKINRRQTRKNKESNYSKIILFEPLNLDLHYHGTKTSGSG